MKKIIRIIAVLLSFVAVMSCGGTEPEAKVSIDGCWELFSVDTKAATIGNVQVSVYVKFDNGKFELYQKIGPGNYTAFTGTYTAIDGTLVGKYSDGKPLASEYSYRVEDSFLYLLTKGGKEEDVYKKITSIPDSVLH